MASFSGETIAQVIAVLHAERDEANRICEQWRQWTVATRAENDTLRARVAELEAAIKLHNDGCTAACASRDEAGLSRPKGSYTGECARTACVQRPANYWNPHTSLFYCVHCARRINEALAKDGLRLIEGLPSPSAKGEANAHD